MEIKPVRLGNQLGHRRLAQDMTPPSFVRTAHDNVPDSVTASEIEKRLAPAFPNGGAPPQRLDPVLFVRPP